jgi:hypothetical protein
MDPGILPWQRISNQFPIDERILSAAGWNKEQLQEVKEESEMSRESIGSLGFDGPLAALSKKRVNLTDYFKEPSRWLPIRLSIAAERWKPSLPNPSWDPPKHTLTTPNRRAVRFAWLASPEQ